MNYTEFNKLKNRNKIVYEIDKDIKNAFTGKQLEETLKRLREAIEILTIKISEIDKELKREY